MWGSDEKWKEDAQMVRKDDRWKSKYKIERHQKDIIYEAEQRKSLPSFHYKDNSSNPSNDDDNDANHDIPTKGRKPG